MDSKQLRVGNDTENEIGVLLRKEHFWVYITPKKVGGQPVDIVAIKNDKVWLLDAKHVREEECSFPFDRIEPNQAMSMKYAKEWANIKNIGFAVKFDRDSNIYYLEYEKWLEMAKNGVKSINMNSLPLLSEVLNA